jgi:hypothetical protein
MTLRRQDDYRDGRRPCEVPAGEQVARVTLQGHADERGSRSTTSRSARSAPTP